MSHFAGIASEIEAVIGATLTAKLLAARGGTPINIPANAAGSTLASIIGVEASQAMIKHFGPGQLSLPMGNARGRAATRRHAIEMFRKGRSLSEVALKSGVHVRTVSRWKAGLDAPEPGLGPLFDKTFDK